MFRRLMAAPLGCQCNQRLQIIRGSKSKTSTRKRDPKQSLGRDVWMAKTGSKSTKTMIRPVIKVPESMTREPEDDIWLRVHFTPPRYTVEEAIDMQREVACPEMMDNMDAPVMLTMETNMATAKKTKFVSDFDGLMVLPHNFDEHVQNKVLAFCKTKEEEDASKEAGAEFAGGIHLVSKVISGDIRPYMFDHAVCTLDFYDSILKTRKQLREKFPHRNKGTVGADLIDLIRDYRFGKNYECIKKFDNFGRLNVGIGRLNMPNEELLVNFLAYVDRVNSHRGTKSGDGANFISQAYIMCPPNGEKMYMKDEYLVVKKKSKFSILEGYEDEDDSRTAAAVN